MVVVHPSGTVTFLFTDIVRHEALFYRVVMKGHHSSFVAADGLKLRAAWPFGTRRLGGKQP